jgi:hypothetical protein
MRSRLDKIEARLQAFIESSLYFLPVDQKQAAFSHHLVAAIEQAVVQEANGSLVAPNLFTVKLHPFNLSIWESRPGLIEALSRILNESAREAGLTFPSAPILKLEADASLPQNHFQIFTATRSNPVDETGVVLVIDEKATVETHPPQAFLILHGNTTIPLTLAVINIGRRSDNQIMIDDPRVSRSHAQLRVVRGHYVLFDLNSTGGTYINAARVSQQVLKPGDVISLAGVPMIYGEENSTPQYSPHDFTTSRLETHIDPPSH